MSAFRDSQSSLSLLGSVSVSCVDLLEKLAAEEDVDAMATCGVLSGRGTIHELQILLPSHLYTHSRHTIRTVPFSMLCKDVNSADASFAFFRAKISRNVSFETRVDIESDPVAAQPTFGVCTKLYGDGGKMAAETYLTTWLTHLHTAGIDMLFVYVLEPLPAALMMQLRTAHTPAVTVVQWGTQQFSAADHRAQRDTYASEVESFFMSALNHCHMRARAMRLAWLFNVDVDEWLHASSAMNEGTLHAAAPRASALQLVAPTHVPNCWSAFHPSVSRPCEEHMQLGRAVSGNVSLRQQLDALGSVSPELRWKSIWRPMRVPLAVDAHGAQDATGVLSPDIAYIQHLHGNDGCATVVRSKDTTTRQRACRSNAVDAWRRIRGSNKAAVMRRTEGSLEA